MQNFDRSGTLKCIEEILLRRKQFLRTIMPRGCYLNVLQIRRITQRNSQRNAIPLTTWKLAKASLAKHGISVINELSSRNSSKSSNSLEIQTDNRTINTPDDMAEAFNEHFTNRSSAS